MKVVRYYIYARKIWYEKWYHDVMHSTIHPRVCTLFYLIGTNIVILRFSASIFNHSAGSSAIPQMC